MLSITPRVSFFLALALGSLALLSSGCASREERIERIQAKAREATFSNRAADALAILEQGLRKYPDSNEIRIDLSRAQLALGDTASAVDLLEAAVAQDPDNDPLWVKIGELHVTLGNSAQAIEALTTYLKNHGDDFLAQKALALEYQKLGRLTDAINAANKWYLLAPSAQPAHTLGQLFLVSGNVAQARSWFGQAAAYPNEPAAKEALAELVQLEIGLKQLQQASAWLDTYLNRYGSSTNDPRITESLAVLESVRRAREEVAQAALAIEEDRRRLEAQRLADEKAAAEAAAKAAVAEPTTEPEPTAPATPEPVAGTRPPAQLFDDTPQTAPAKFSDPVEDPIALSQRDTALDAIARGDFDAAVPLLWELLGENAEDAPLWAALARAYYQQQSWFDAEACSLQARRLAPRDPAVADLYLNAILKTQEPARAIEEIKAARLLFPDSPAIALTLARALRQGKAAQPLVANAYQAYISLTTRADPGYAEAIRFLQTGE